MDEEIGNRIRRLERSNLVLLSLFFLLLAALGLGMATHSTSPMQEVLQATAFQLVDSDGKVIAELTKRDGGPGLFLKDPQGKDRVATLYTHEQGGLFIYNEAGDTRLGAALFSHGGAGFALHGQEMKGAAVLYYKASGTLSFFDKDGNIIQRFPINGDQE